MGKQALAAVTMVSKVRSRVLVVFETGRAGALTLDLARDLALADDASLTIVGVAPGAPTGPRCGNSAFDYNRAVTDAVAEELDRARAQLAEFGIAAGYEVVLEDAHRSLSRFARDGQFDLVLLPSRRRPLRGPWHPAAAGLRAATEADVQIVDPRARAGQR